MSEAAAILPESISITQIPLKHVDHYWGVVAPMLEKATEESRGRYNIDAVYQEIKSGTHYLWVIFQGDDDILASFTTQFCHYPLKVNAAVLFCGSRDGAEMDGMAGKWVEAMEMFKEWAKFSGCDGIEIVGRKGWSRIFKNSGFEESYVTIESEV